ncbi:MAG: LOG family protein [Candidatus Sericytochromatia bacterium]
MSLADLPFQPIRGGLYTPEELFAGFDPSHPMGYTAMRDFEVYRYFVRHGRATPTDPLTSMMEALHDNAVNQALVAFLQRRRVVAIMGGHKVRRDTAAYADVARLARELARHGLLMASGGGPGAMEATHLGALLSRSPDPALDAALAVLAAEPELPASGHLVSAQGDVDRAVAERLHRWFRVAFELERAVEDRGESLAVPTWHYGHEPTSPFASHVAKYFQNSIREDGLLAIATHGIVYSPGSAGTLQEVFQDAAQNFYHSFGDCFSPMVFYGVDFWTRALPVRPLLEALFRTDPARAAEFATQVLFTDDVAEIVAFLASRAPSAAQLADHWQSLGSEERPASKP